VADALIHDDTLFVLVMAGIIACTLLAYARIDRDPRAQKRERARTLALGELSDGQRTAFTALRLVTVVGALGLAVLLHGHVMLIAGVLIAGFVLCEAVLAATLVIRRRAAAG